ncbi:hypothetical protein ABK040_005100 [Willaertia magna]
MNSSTTQAADADSSLYNDTVSSSFLYNEILDITSLAPCQNARHVFALVDIRSRADYENNHLLISTNVDLKAIIKQLEEENITEWEELLDRNPGLVDFQQALFQKANYSNQQFILYGEDSLTKETVDLFVHKFLPHFPRNIVIKSLKVLEGGYKHFTEQYGICLCSSFEFNSEERDDTLLPNEIVPGFLFLGAYIHAYDLKALKELKITKIVNITPEPHEDHIIQAYGSFQVDIADHQTMDIKQYFEDAVKYIKTCKDNGEKVLVHCQKGISRSASIIIAYLMAGEKMTFAAAYQLVKQCRKFIRPNKGFAKQLGEYEMELNPELKRPTYREESSSMLERSSRRRQILY